MRASIYCHRHSTDKFVPQGAPAVLQYAADTLVLTLQGKEMTLKKSQVWLL